MFRFLLRLTGLLSLAGAFATLLLDGTRSLAGGRILLTPIAEFIGARVSLIERGALSLHPILWNPVTTNLLRLPAWLLLTAVGLLLLQLSRQPQPLVGYSDR